MEQVGRVRTGAGEQVDPGSDEPFVGGIVDGGKDTIGRIRAILVRGRERNGRGQRLCKLKRGRVLERVDVDPGEEARRVGWLARPPERARGERQLPPCGRQGVSERARDLRRAAAGEKEERRDDESAQDGASTANRLLPARFDSRPPAGRGGARAAAAAGSRLDARPAREQATRRKEGMLGAPKDEYWQRGLPSYLLVRD